MLGDRDILALDESMLVETEDRLVILFTRSIGKQPPVPAMMQQLAVLIFGMLPESPDRAFILVHLPLSRIESSVGIQRSLEFVAAGWAALGIFRRARQLQANFLQ